MNSNTYLNNNYKSNERALADLLGQLVRGRNASPPSFSRGGVGGGGISSGGLTGVGGSMNNYGGPSMGQSGSGGGGWGGNAPNDWSQRGGGGVFGSGNSGGFGGGGSVGSNIMPLMQGSVGGFGGMSRGDGLNNGYGGGGGGGGGGGIGMSQNDNFGRDYMSMSRNNQGGFGGMNSGGFGGGGYSQNDDDFGNSPSAPRSRGMWVSGGSTNRSSRNRAPSPVRVRTRSRPRPSNETPSRRRRRSLSRTKVPLPSKSLRRSGPSASASSALRSSQTVKSRGANVSAGSTGPLITSSSAQGTKAAASFKPTNISEPRKVLTSLGGRWYQHFLRLGFTPELARKKAFVNNEKPFTPATEVPAKRKRRPPLSPELFPRVGIFAKGFPEHLLDPEDLSSLEELIVDEVANNSTASKLQFERLIKKPGMLIIDCVNQHTADWLKEIIPNLTNWENPELEIANEEDIPDANVMTISLSRSAGQEYDQTLAIIQAQNDGLVTDSWEWVHERTDGDKLFLTVRVDDESYKTLKERRWKIFYKFGLIEVNFARYLRYALSKQRKKDEDAKKQSEEKAAKGEKGADGADKTAAAEASEQQAEEEDSKEEINEEEGPPSPPPAPIISIED